MMRRRDLATIRAALRFWRDEIVPHGVNAASPYFRAGDPSPLERAELIRLLGNLETLKIGYVKVDPVGKKVLQTRIQAKPQRNGAAILYRG
ncbi:hypothetical protein [Blastopirellula marina]|uniref:Uncharacterized protein n=1 Tax=Blastopirellula marina TaxID=124 RepID=A0A2S8GH92_9BACT|nr:hypothetical protein [Blastopirellula marina]PQO43832.1 hypothetical protein C5Y93_21845 [Blastopirellula marina]